MFKILISLIFALAGLQGFSQQLQFRGGHSHNDYNQEQPFFNACDHGMVSIEADIFLRKGQLLAGHNAEDLTAGRTLKSLYLNPIRKRITENPKNFSPIILLVDIKDRGEATYQKLKETLKEYSGILSEYSKGRIIKRQVTIILSGDRPVKTLRTEKKRYAFIDGRMTKNDIHDTASLMPLISDDWNSFFNWQGKGNIPADEFEKLKSLVEQCHKNHKMIRLWGYPNNSKARQKYWQILKAAKVDLIGCDCPECLEKFLKTEK